MDRPDFFVGGGYGPTDCTEQLLYICFKITSERVYENFVPYEYVDEATIISELSLRFAEKAPVLPERTACVANCSEIFST
jgi:hypothetical protein